MARSRFELRFDPPYDKIFEGILSFKRLSDAEYTIGRLADLRQRYLAEHDAKGAEYCRQVALAGRKRAESISRNRRITAAKRLQKQEIAYWFRVWLETPELFRCWLDLRKQTAEYQGVLNSDEPDADTQSMPGRGHKD